VTRPRDQSGTDDRTTPSRRGLLATTGAVCGTLLAGCLGDDTGSSGGGSSSSNGETDDEMGESSEMDDTDDGMGDTSTDMGEDDEMSSVSAWRTAELRTVRDDEQFSIESLDGPVVVQSFAVWCPKCERQSKNMQELDDSVTVVGLNTDPNEDAAKVRDHAESNGFDWRFAVAPTEMTESLVDEFGTTVTNAPSTPVIVACESGESTFMSGGIQSADEITAAADEC